MHGIPITLGSYATKDWLRARGLDPGATRRWFVEVALDVVDRPAVQMYSGTTDTRFHLNLYPEEWSFFVCHVARASWIRVTDQPFVHGHDDYQLVRVVPLLADIGALLRGLEARFHATFHRDHAMVRSNIPDAESRVRRWLATL